MRMFSLRAVGCSAAVSLAVLGLEPGTAHATHSTAGEVNTLRPSLGEGEGYLNFVSGAEYTGHTNGIETARDGGQDFADNWITINNIVVTDSNGVAAGVGGLIDDLEFSRKVYAQAGIAVRLEGTAMIDMTDFAGIGDSPFSDLELQAIRQDGSGRSANADTINIYHVPTFDGASPPNGITTAPKNAVVTMAPGVFVRDGRATSTHPHEIGHMVLNGPVLHDEIPGNTSHSNDNTNFMYVNSSNAPATLTDVGPKIGAIGNHSIIERAQIAAIHGNPGNGNPGYVKHSNNIATHGDRADFDWVTDQRIIETGGGANGADIEVGSDWLIWEINPGQVMPSGHSGPGGDGHFHKASALERPGYAAASFNTVDVFSNINQYADNDTPGGVGAGEAVRRVKAQDYLIPEFSVDGSSWKAGELVNTFRPGWTTGALSDDFVSRYKTDIEAKFLRIAAVALNSNGHDGNTQIDAILAHTIVPETPWIPWVPESILDPGIDGPSLDDSILIQTPEGNTEIFIPDARFYDPSIFNFTEVPVTANAAIVGDNLVIDVILSQPLPDAFFESGNGLDMLLNFDLFGPGTSLLEIPFSDAASPNLPNSPFFETLVGDTFGDTSLRVVGDEVLQPDSDHFASISLETAEGVDLLHFEPNVQRFSGISSADVEIFFSLAPVTPGGSGFFNNLNVGESLFTVTLATAAQGVVPEPASLVLLGAGLFLTTGRRRRRVSA